MIRKPPPLPAAVLPVAPPAAVLPVAPPAAVLPVAPPAAVPRRCADGYTLSGVIQRHVPAILQMSCIKLKTFYHLAMIVTKCLNTAVFVVFILVGKQGVDRILTCNTDVVKQARATDVRRTHQAETATPPWVPAAALRDAVLGSDTPAVIFVMLTHAVLVMPGDAATRPVTYSDSEKVADDDKDSVMFPGHVFVIERHAGPAVMGGDGGRIVRYSLFQSYIDKYDLGQHIIEHPEKLGMERSAVTALLDGLVAMLKRDVWTAETSAYWGVLTGAPADHCKQFEGRLTGERILPCYREIAAAECGNHLLSLAAETLVDISAAEAKAQATSPHAGALEALGATTYGDPSLYAVDAAYTKHTVPPLTHARMKEEAMQIVSEINSLPYLQMQKGGVGPKNKKTTASAAKKVTAKKPASTNAAARKPESTNAAAKRPASTNAAARKPESMNAAAKRPASTNAAAMRPASTNAAAKRPASTNAAAKRPASTNAAARRPASTNAAARRPASTNAAAKRPASTNAAAKRPASTNAATKRRRPVHVQIGPEDAVNIPATPHGTVVLIHSPRCGHCVAMRPEWDAVVPRLLKMGLNVAEVDVQAMRGNTPMAAALQKDPSFQGGVPHIVWMSEDMANLKPFDGMGRDAKSISAWGEALVR